ncbi:MAG: hypothetical protein ACXWZL_07005, partial [Mycobacterium sp.]
LIDSEVEEGYGKVADSFKANFVGGREVGAALTVYRYGVKVVDLWGGYRDGFTKCRGSATPWSTRSRPPKALPHW